MREVRSSSHKGWLDHLYDKIYTFLCVRLMIWYIYGLVCGIEVQTIQPPKCARARQPFVRCTPLEIGPAFGRFGRFSNPHSKWFRRGVVCGGFVCTIVMLYRVVLFWVVCIEG